MSNFFAMLSRMKYINRWGLMRNTQSENIAEHSLETAYIAHALAIIREKRFGIPTDAERAAVLAMFHDCTEIITGDMPTPVKYHSPEIRRAYREVEELAAGNLLALLPEDLRPAYESVFDEEREEDAALRPLIKAADKLSAIIKCIEERKTGNREFVAAEAGLRRALEEMQLPEAKVFAEEFLPAYEQSIDDHLTKR